MAGESDPEERPADRFEDRERLKEAVQASQSDSKALMKDAAALVRQAALLKARAAETRAEAQEARALAGHSSPPAPLLSIPEAARLLHVAERALRHVLTEPDLEARLIERTRKVGIYYKFIPLLPPDLMADLPARLPDRKTPGHGEHGRSAGKAGGEDPKKG